MKKLCDLGPDFIFANAYGHLRLGLESRQSLFPAWPMGGMDRIAHSIEDFEAGETMMALWLVTCGLAPATVGALVTPKIRGRRPNPHGALAPENFKFH